MCPIQPSLWNCVHCWVPLVFVCLSAHFARNQSSALTPYRTPRLQNTTIGAVSVEFRLDSNPTTMAEYETIGVDSPDFSKLTPEDQVILLKNALAAEREKRERAAMTASVEQLVAEQVRQQLEKLSLSHPEGAMVAAKSSGLAAASATPEAGTSNEARKLFSTPGVSGGGYVPVGTHGAPASSGGVSFGPGGPS